jgi:transcriptional regulator with XRE-family HTH domain
MIDTRKVRSERERLGLSMRAAAKAAGMSLGQWYDIEHGRWKSPQVSTAERVARALQCTVTDLLTTRQIRQKAVA